MKRNKIIQSIDQLRYKLLTIIVPAGSVIEREKWMLVGECERFGNNLCHAPTAHNRRLGAIVYTVRDAQKKLGELKKKIQRWGIGEKK